MSPFTIGLLLNLLRAAPTIANEFEAAIKEAKSPDEINAKVKAIIDDLEKALSAIAGVL